MSSYSWICLIMVSLKTVLNIVCNIHNINCNAMDSFGSVCVCECLCGGERESHRTDLDHFSPFTQILALPIALASSVASSKQASPFSAHTKPKKKKIELFRRGNVDNGTINITNANAFSHYCGNFSDFTEPWKASIAFKSQTGHWSVEWARTAQTWRCPTVRIWFGSVRFIVAISHITV